MLAAISFYSFVLFVHIAAVVLGFGVIFAYPVFWEAARRGDERHLPFFHRVQSRLGARLISPALVVILLAGLYLAFDGPYEFSDPWIGATLLILIVLGGIGGGYLAPRERTLAELAQRDVTRSNAEGPLTMSDDYRQLFAKVRVASLAMCGLVLLAIFLMVTKPGA